jgi:hypothetical protein
MNCCRTCIQTYLLQDDAPTARCPSCRSGWTDDFLSENLTKTFLLKEYKEHREKILLDRERARLPETQEDAGRYIQAKRKIATDYMPRIVAIQDSIRNLHETIEEKRLYMIYKEESEKKPYNRETVSSAYTNFANYRSSVFMPRVMPYYREMKRIRDREYNQLLRLVASHGKPLAQRNTTAAHVERNEWTFHMKCAKEGCEGFVGNNWKCGLCEEGYCKHCRETNTEGHVCDPEKRMTAEALQKEAKPCPKCAAQISKIDGCDQMWCTQCKTAFSWRTGRIEESHIHNPHYFEWMRRNGQAATMRPLNGGDCLEAAEVLTHVLHYNRPHQEIVNWCRTIRHFEWVTRSTQRQVQHVGDDDRCRAMRVLRLANELTDEGWKKKLQKDEKSAHKNQRVVQVLETFTQAATDILRGALLETADREALVKQVEDLQAYCNQELEKIEKRYKNEVRRIEHVPTFY